MGQQPRLLKRLHGKRSLQVWFGGVVIQSLLLWGLMPPAIVFSSEELFPIPDALRPNVRFWKKTFAEVEVTGGILHDMHDLSIIYETLQQLPSNSQERQSTISGYREYYQSILATLAEGKRQDLSNDEARVLALFNGKDSSEVFAVAAANIRFQGGMRERFMRGIIRSGTYRPEIESIFASFGLPLALTYLPHVESSFENRALSKVGAAGIWQIMPATGRRYLTVNGRVDERLDIQAATMAAAQIFQENYEQLGTWPLAITAYNHGLYGMKQAVETMGTQDFNVIFQYYRGPLFGFASQNFYAEFLAALDVAQNYQRYFGDIYLDPPTPFSTMVYQQRDNDAPDQKTLPPTLSVALAPLPPPLRETPSFEPEKNPPIPSIAVVPQARETNVDYKEISAPPMPVVTRQVQDTIGHDHTIPALTPHVTLVRQIPTTSTVEDNGSFVTLRPPTFRQIREPVVQEARSTLPVQAATVRQGRESSEESTASASASTSHYRVQSGDTLRAIAQRFRTTTAQLSALNKFPPRYRVKTGETLAVAMPTLPTTVPEKSTPPQVVAKGTTSPLFIPVKPAVPEISPAVAAANAPKPVRVHTAKTNPGKPVFAEIARPVTVVSATKTATVKTMSARAAKAVMARPIPAEIARAAPAHSAKLVVTKTPVTPATAAHVTKTSLSTRATTRRPNIKGT